MKGLVRPMSVRLKSLILLGGAILLPAATAVAQVRPVVAAPRPGVPIPRPVATPTPPPPVTAVPGKPGLPSQPQVAAPAPVPLPPPIWDMQNAQDLLFYIQQIGREGLNPADYDPNGLIAAMRSGDPITLSRVATERFDLVSSDLALGHVRKDARGPWYVVDPDLDATQQDDLLRRALAAHRITDSLNGLLPTHSQYAALKAALEVTPATEKAKINRIRLNLDRWRWLPRDLGPKYIIVNVPGFHATLVENGVNRWKHKAIAGATKTPTPQLSATAVGVMLNPSWEVPKSIEGEVRGKKGFVPVMKDGKLDHWRQPPGPTNALGQVKFVMYNPHNIYLHDTNARSRFSSRMRALSHGCVRTEHILDLATELLGDDGGTWTPEKIQATLAAKKTVQANFVKPLPVYIVYFSSAALLDGKIVDYNDLYGRDAKALTALNMKDGGASLAKPKAKPADQVASR